MQAGRHHTAWGMCQAALYWTGVVVFRQKLVRRGICVPQGLLLCQNLKLELSVIPVQTGIQHGFLFCRDLGETFCQRFKARWADKPNAIVGEPPERKRQEVSKA